jgi:hypothetical protein
LLFLANPEPHTLHVVAKLHKIAQHYTRTQILYFCSNHRKHWSMPPCPSILHAEMLWIWAYLLIGKCRSSWNYSWSLGTGVAFLLSRRALSRNQNFHRLLCKQIQMQRIGWDLLYFRGNCSKNWSIPLCSSTMLKCEAQLTLLL